MKRILFQGDSITDVGRNREGSRITGMGMGYPLMIAGELGYEDVEKYEFVNRGISGSRIVDLYARIKMDIWNLKPDLLSMLVGVNDVWHEFRRENGVDVKRYENIYRTLLTETMEVLPDIKIILMEPFTLKGEQTEEFWEEFRHEVELRAEAVRRIAADYNLPFVELQEKFDEAAKKTSPEKWLVDGIHPTPAGHRLIANAWLECFTKINL